MYRAKFIKELSLEFIEIQVLRLYTRKITVRTIVIYDLKEDFVDSYLRVNTRKWAFLRDSYDLRVNKKSPYVGNPNLIGRFFFFILVFQVRGKEEDIIKRCTGSMVITILSAAGKKGILKLMDLASLQFNNQVL